HVYASVTQPFPPISPCLFLLSLRFHLLCFLFFYCVGALRHLHSFPTRRSSDLGVAELLDRGGPLRGRVLDPCLQLVAGDALQARDRKSTRLNSSHVSISYAVFCLKKKKLYNHPGSNQHFDLTSRSHVAPPYRE